MPTLVEQKLEPKKNFGGVAGVFGMAKYGGNRDNVGWKLVGMNGPPGAWTYPFGDYDAEHTGGNGNDA